MKTYKPGDIVTSALTGGEMMVLEVRKPENDVVRYDVRLQSGGISTVYDFEIKKS